MEGVNDSQGLSRVLLHFLANRYSGKVTKASITILSVSEQRGKNRLEVNYPLGAKLPPPNCNIRVNIERPEPLLVSCNR